MTSATLQEKGSSSMPPGEVRLQMTFKDGYPLKSKALLPKISLLHSMLVADFPSDGADAVVALAIDAARQALEGKEEGEPSMCCYQAIVAANGAMADGTWRGGGGGGGGGARSNGMASAEEEQEQPEAKAAADEAATAATIRRLTAEAQQRGQLNRGEPPRRAHL